MSCVSNELPEDAVASGPQSDKIVENGAFFIPVQTLQLSCLSPGSSEDPLATQEVFQARTQHLHFYFPL